MMYIHLIGVIAGVCTTASFVPQILKILKTRHVRDISLQMYIVLTTGIFLWLVYGILIRAFPVILANGVAFLLCTWIVVMKIVYGRGEDT